MQRLIRRQKNTGQVSAKAHGGGKKALITQEDLIKVQQLVDAQPDALLSELCEHLAAQTGIVVSVTTMHRAVQRLKLTTKKTLDASVQESPRVEKLRYEYRDWVLTVDPHDLIFVDESGLNLGMTRLYGRARSGERLHDCRPRNCGENVSLIGALSMNGLIATMSIPGSVNTLPI